MLRVSALTRLIKNLIEGAFESVWVEGEVSNVSQPASGHLYFTLKDEAAQIRAVMWRGDCRLLRFSLKDGMQIRVFGEVAVYEKGGVYQIVVRRMEEAGKGSLQAAFEALKKKLQAEGLFDPGRKKAIPLLPAHIGIVTSPTGAAIRDILKVLLRRFPNVHVVLAPVRVQGDGAAEDIAAAIDLFNCRGGVDVLIVGRGGGSLEDLWCFNEEAVARAIARSAIPVISAVGHEVDFTISDFVADLRAPTPSAAAEMVVGQKDAFAEMLDQMSGRLVRALRERSLTARNRLIAAGRSYVFREPRTMIRDFRQRLGVAGLQMRHGLQERFAAGQQRTDESNLRLGGTMQKWQAVCRGELKAQELRLRALNPLAVLERGYSLTKDRAGRIVRSADDVKEGDRVFTTLARGALESEVVNRS